MSLLASKSGALRDGASFLEWELLTSMNRIRFGYMKVKVGDHDFFELLMLVQEHGIYVVETACKLAVKQNTLCFPVITNLINQLVKPVIPSLSDTYIHS